ncbi:MAG: right-handed parallel beta-helix repeat-containing protein [archaeon]
MNRRGDLMSWTGIFVLSLVLVGLFVLGVQYVGAGGSATTGGNSFTIIQCGDVNESGSYTITSDILDGLFNSTGCLNITANNIFIDGQNHLIRNNSLNKPAINLFGVNNITITRLDISMLSSSSILSGVINVVSSNNSNFSYISISASQNGIYLKSSQNNIFEIIKLNTTGGSSIYIGEYQNSSNNNIFHRINITAGGTKAIDIEYSSNTSVYDSLINNSGANYGIFLNGVSGVNVNNSFYNLILYCGSNCIYPQGSSFNRIYNNNIIASTSGGMYLWTSSNNNVIYGNSVSSGGNHGISISFGANNVIYNNTIFAGGFGTYFGAPTSNNNIYYNNFVNVSGSNGLFVATSGNMVYNNIVYANSSGLVVGSTNNSFLNNTITVNWATGISITSNGNNFSNNVVSANNQTISFSSTADSNIFLDSSFLGPNIQVYHATSAGKKNYMINASYSSEVVTGGTIFREYYLYLYANNSNGLLAGANVSIYNVTGSFLNSSLTNSSGGMRQLLISYANSGIPVSYSNYTINSTKAGYVAVSVPFNLTANSVAWINMSGRVLPGVSLTSPSSGSSYSGSSYAVSFVWDTVDSGVGIANCSVYANGVGYDNTSAINSTNNNQIITLSSGSYNTYVNCTDVDGNTGNSSSITFTITAPVIESSSITLSTPSAGDSSLTDGVTRTLTAGTQFSFNFVSNSGDREYHSLRVNSIYTNSAVLTLYSTPIKFNISVGETKGFDTNGNGMNDVSVTLQSISFGRAEVFVKKISESTVSLGNQTTTGNTGNVANQTVGNNAPETVPSENGMFMQGLLEVAFVVVLIAIIVVGFLLHSSLRFRKGIRGVKIREGSRGKH